MNYKKIYDSLILRGQLRNISSDQYTETHHIIPVCMGGTYAVSNLVKLYPEEHYLAHQLLVKIFPGNHKLAFAVKAMCTSSKTHGECRNNKMFGWIKRAVAEALSEREVTEETRQKMSKASRYKPKSAQHVESLKAGCTTRNKPRTEEEKANISAAIAARNAIPKELRPPGKRAHQRAARNTSYQLPLSAN